MPGRDRGRRRAAGRDAFDIASRNFHTVQPYTFSKIVVRPAERSRYLMEIEDRRAWMPSRYTPKRVSGVPVRRLIDAGNDWRYSQPGFAGSTTVAICVRRKSRREVLFAIGGAGAGKRVRKGRRNYYSNVRC